MVWSQSQSRLSLKLTISSPQSSSCGTWVRRPYKTLPKPLRPPGIGNVVLQPPETGRISVGPGTSSDRTPPGFPSSYSERIAYKNMSIYVTELPPTPRAFRNRCEPGSSSVTIRTMKLTSIPPAAHDKKAPTALYFKDTPLRLASVPSRLPLLHHSQYPPASPFNDHSLRLASLPAIPPVSHHGQYPTTSPTLSLTGKSSRTTLKPEAWQGAQIGANPLGGEGGGGPTSENQRTVTHSNRFLYGEQYHPYSRLIVNRNDLNTRGDTLFLGNLPPDTSEEELRAIFSKQPGYKRLCFRIKQSGPICFVLCDDVVMASRAVYELDGYKLSNSVKSGIRLSFSKNQLDVRSNEPASMKPTNWLSDSDLLGSSSRKNYLTAAVVDLSERVDDWKSLKMETFGDLLRFGTFPIAKVDSGEDIEREVGTTQECSFFSGS